MIQLKNERDTSSKAVFAISNEIVFTISAYDRESTRTVPCGQYACGYSYEAQVNADEGFKMFSGLGLFK